MSAPLSATLLDEELVLLAPDAGPLPWLDEQSEADVAAVLRGAARSLLLRGLADTSGDRLDPAPGLAPLVAPLAVPLWIEVVSLVPGRPGGVLTVLRPAAAGQVLVQDVTADGVHLLTLLPAHAALALLVTALDPLGAVRAGPARTEPGGERGGSGRTGAGRDALQRPDAVGRAVAHPASGPPRSWGVVSGGGCWQVPEQPGTRPVPLDAAGLDRLAAEVLAVVAPQPDGRDAVERGC